MQIFENVHKFLMKQKSEMQHLDKAEGLTKREDRGQDFALVDSATGRRKGMREILYENTINWIFSEEGQKMLLPEMLQLMQPGVLNEDTLTTGISTFTTSLLPAVRRMYARNLAMELISTQPMTGPTGFIYWLDHVYGTSSGGATADQRLDRYEHPNYADSSEEGTIPEVGFKLKSQSITAGTKKLKATWSLEAAQDLSSQWKLDLWGELRPQLVDEIAREINRLIITALYAGAGAGNVSWDLNGGLSGDRDNSLFQRFYYKTLYYAIQEAANKVFKRKFVQPNWLLMSSDIFTFVSKIEHFTADPGITPDQESGIGWRYEGILANKYKVYVDPWITDNRILIGYKGADWKYACGYYAPYIPVFLSEEYIVNFDFTQRARGAMTRYKAGVLPESDTDPLNYMMATVTVENLSS
jgi:hypothetical protein